MNNLKSWINTFEELKELQKKPFEQHLASSILNEHEQNCYSVLHTAFILFNGSISQSQERLYKFWLPAISTELKLSEVINQAQGLDGDKLRESIKLIKEKELFELLLLDVLVFSRLDGSLSEDLKNILNECCQLFEIKQQTMNDVLAICDSILGIEILKTPKLNVTLAKLIGNSTWSEFYIRELNSSSIMNFEPGIWMVNKDINIQESLEIENSILVFYNNSKILKRNYPVTIKNSGLINPKMDIFGASLHLNSCMLISEDSDENKVTSITNISGTVRVNECDFFMKGIRVIENNSDGKLEINNSEFDYCGCKMLVGGVVYSQNIPTIKNSKFYHCNALLGGALCIEYTQQNSGWGGPYYSLESCLFQDCNSTLNQDSEQYTNFGGLYLNFCQGESIYKCEFNTNITILNTSYRSIKSSFFSGFIYYAENNSTRDVLDSTTIKDSGLSNPHENIIPKSNLISWKELQCL